MLLKAVQETRRGIQDNPGGGGQTEGYRAYSCETLSSGESKSFVTFLGVHPPETCYDGLSSNSRNELRPARADFVFEDEAVVRPWLYGNWWSTDDHQDTPSQLIGLGVRLGVKPGIEHAEGNSEVNWCRGTKLRVRINDG